MKIIIADTSVHIGRKMGEFLAQLGHDARICATLADARAALEEERPQAILLDASLPDGGALELCYLARQVSSTPTIVVMASKRVDPGSLALFDFDEKLDKPFTGRDLRNLIDSIARSVPTPLMASTDMSMDSDMVPPSIDGDDEGVVSQTMLRTVMQNAGSLGDTPFPALLYKLFANRSTGVLSLMRDGHERSIFLLDGEPVYATSNSATDSLSAVLVRYGFISLETLNHVLDERGEGQSLGPTLVERGLISPERLLEALERQIYERILRCFSFNSGAYIFASGKEWASEVRHFRQNPIQLICDGVHRFVGPNVLAAHLQDKLGKFIVRTEKFAWFEPFYPRTAWRQSVMDQIGGSGTLQSLTIDYSLDIMDLLRLVWSLHLADMVDFLDEPRTTAVRSPHKPPLPTRSPTLHELDPDVLAQAIEEARAMNEEDEDDNVLPPEESAATRLTKVVLDYTMRLGKEDHWQLLGISEKANTDEAREALKAALAKLPREDISTLPPQIRVQAIEVREALQRAFQTLIEPMSRRRYSARLNNRKRAQEIRSQAIRPLRRPGSRNKIEARDQPSPPAKPIAPAPQPDPSDEGLATLSRPKPKRQHSTPFESEDPLANNDPETEAAHGHVLIHLRRAKRAIERHRWKEAYQQVKAASDLDGNNNELNVLMAWIVYNLPHKDKTRQYRVCRNRIEVELTLDSVMPDAHYYLGAMAEAQGDVLEAIQQYRAALTLAPRHQEARESVARLRDNPEVIRATAAAAEEEDSGVVGSFRNLFKRR